MPDPHGNLRGRLIGVLGLIVLTALVLGGVFVATGGAAGEPATSELGSLPSGPQIGTEAPAFKALDIDGNPVQLADYDGKPVWLLFQATWCSTCRAELPDVEEASDRIDVVAIYLREDRSLVSDYADRMGLSIRSVPDPIGEISLAYLATSVPTHYFIDAEGVVRAIHKGALSPAEIDEKLAAVGVDA